MLVTEIYLAPDEFKTHCPLPDCDIVFEAVRREHQQLANQLKQILFIPAECCYHGHLTYAVVKVSPKILPNDEELLK